MKCYDETKLLYIKTNVSVAGLGAALPQTSSTSFLGDKAQDNSILRPIAFVNNSLSSVENRYSNTEREALGILYRLKKFHHYCFLREVRVISDHKLLVAIFKKRCSITVTGTTINSTQNTPMQSQNHIQARTRSIHSILALQTKPQEKQRHRNMWHVVKY